MKKLVTILCCCVMLCYTAVALAQELMPVEELRAGMRGYGLTVLNGENIESFDVQVIGVMPRGGDDHLIVVQVSGDVIERAGGVAQGMSGSPVYIDGKLVGAVAYGWAMSDGRTTMLTPIATMIKLWDNMQSVEQQKLLEQQQAAARLKAINEKQEPDLPTQAAKIIKQKQSEVDIAVDTAKQADSGDKDRAEDNKSAKDKKAKAKAKSKENQDSGSTVDAANSVKQEPADSKREQERKPANKDDKTAADNKQPKKEQDNSDRANSLPPIEGTKPANYTIGLDSELKAQYLKRLKMYRTPLMAAGFTPAALEKLRDGLKEFDIAPYEIGTGNELNQQPLQPGSALSADLVKGDISLGALGTVTYVEEDKVLAFGHPFLKLGSVDYFLSHAWMLTPIKSINTSFKLGISTGMIGAVKQDRNSGIAGRLGVKPDSIPVVIRVNDQDRKQFRSFSMQLVNHERLTPVILESAVQSCAERVLDRTGEGTAMVDYTIWADNLPEGKKISRRNMLYSQNNVVAGLTGELNNAMSLLNDNRFQGVNIKNIAVDIDITSACQVVRIATAQQFGAQSAAPGEKVDIQVTLEPYRDKKITRIVEYELPKDLPAGKVQLMVRGGASIAWIQALLKQQQKDITFLEREMGKDKSFGQYIDDFNNQDNNQDIVVDIMPEFLTAAKAAKQKKTSGEKSIPEKTGPDKTAADKLDVGNILFGSPNKKATPTEYLVTGDAMVTIEIKKP